MLHLCSRKGKKVCWNIVKKHRSLRLQVEVIAVVGELVNDDVKLLSRVQNLWSQMSKQTRRRGVY